MKKTITAIVALASVITATSNLSSLAQEGGQDGIAPTNSVTVQVKDYTFTVQTDKNTYDPDESIVLAVKVKYSGTTSVYFDTSAAPFFGNITVLYRGVPCPQTLFYREGAANSFWYGHGVQPFQGWEHTFSMQLNRLFDMTRGGEYQIWFKRQVPDKQFPSGNRVIECGPITIHIRPGSEFISNK